MFVGSFKHNLNIKGKKKWGKGGEQCITCAKKKQLSEIPKEMLGSGQKRLLLLFTLVRVVSKIVFDAVLSDPNLMVLKKCVFLFSRFLPGTSRTGET